VVPEGSAKAAASQSILPVQQAVLHFDCTTLAAAYVTCIDVQEDGICSVIAGTAEHLLPGCPHPCCQHATAARTSENPLFDYT
jgi:hypothetical protein